MPKTNETADAIDRLLAARADILDNGTPVKVSARDHDVDAHELRIVTRVVVNAEVRRRDGHACYGCASVGSSNDVHHRKPRGAGGTSDPAREYGMENLITLCRTCHDHAETNRNEARDLGRIVHSAADPASIPVVDRRGTAWTLTADGQRIPGGKRT